MIDQMYQARQPSRSEFVKARHLNHHVRVWGHPQEGRAPLVLVHGWMDVSASWQFVVDAMQTGRWILAPDWRGFGLSSFEGPAPDSYWFPDYLLDLDMLLDQLVGEQPVDLAGHSMGGNIAMMYAGVRPQRVRRLINLEGFGLPESRPPQAPARLAQWMDQVKALHQGDSDLKTYDSSAAVARRLMKTNARLPQDKADWLAQHWAQPDARGSWRILGEPAHKVVNAYLYQVPEVLEIYKCIRAPVLSVTASDDSMGQWWGGRFTLDQYQQRLQVVAQVEQAVIQDAGHMLHHDQPQALARLMEAFLTR